MNVTVRGYFFEHGFWQITWFLGLVKFCRLWCISPGIWLVGLPTGIDWPFGWWLRADE